MAKNSSVAHRYGAKQAFCSTGTLPLHGDIARICDALKYTDEHERETAKVNVRERATTLEAVAGYRITWEDAAAAIIEGFAETFDTAFIESQLTDDERTCVDVLVKEQYAHPDWTNKR